MKRGCFCIVILCLCTRIGQVQAQIPVIEVPPATKESIVLSDIIEKIVREVRLEQVKDVWLSSVRRMVIDGENLFLRDYKQEQVFRFDMSGKFLNRIGQIGHGPKEYLFLGGFCVDSSSKRIYLMTDKGIKSFDYEGNNKEEYRNIGSLSYGCLCFREGLLYALGEELGRKTEEGRYQNITTLYRLTPNLKLKDSVLFQCVTQDRNLFSFSWKEMNFSINGRDLYIYKPILTLTSFVPDTLYQWAGNRILPALRLDFGEVPYIQGVKDIRIINIFRTQRFLFCNYASLKNDIFWYFYDFHTRTGVHSSKEFRDDLLNRGRVELFPLDLDRGLMYFIKHGYQLEGEVEGITENDNPVVYIVELKKM